MILSSPLIVASQAAEHLCGFDCDPTPWRENVLILLIIIGLGLLPALIAAVIVWSFERLFPRLPFYLIRASAIALPTLPLLGACIWLENSIDRSTGGVIDMGSNAAAGIMGLVALVSAISTGVYAMRRKDRRDL